MTFPFTTLAQFEAINGNAGVLNPQAGDDIFIYTGSGNYTGGVTLENNQKMIGDGSSGTLAAILGITLAPGSDALPIFSGTDPTIENAAGNGITLASGNTIRGLTVGNTPSSFGYSGGALNISTSGTVGTVQFDNLSSTSAPSQGINLVSVTGTITVTSGSISNPTGTAVAVGGGSVSMTYPGNITQGNNASTVSVSNGHTGTLTFQTGTISVTNGNGLQFDNADGTYNFNGTTTLNGGDAGIDILNGSIGTFTFGTGATITRGNGVSGAAFNLLSSNANVTYNGSMTLGTSTGNMVAIDNHDAGTITFNTGNLTKGSSTTQGISISNSNGGSINFNNPTISITMTTGNAASLTSNTGGTMNFAISAGGSGMDLTTTSGTGFNATGGGTVSVTGSGNTISSTTGTALNVASTTIGASNLNFQSISSNGGTNGIVLNTTGSSGGLNVTGTGTTDGTGGTIQSTTGRGASFISASNITLKNMNFTNAGTSDLDADNSGLSTGDNLATNAAIHLQSVTTATLDNVNISGGAEQGINGNTVSNFTLSNSSIVDVGNEPTTSGTITVQTPPPPTNLLVNGGFESGTANWTFMTNGAGTFTTVSPGNVGAKAGQIIINTQGTAVQLYQQNISLTSGNMYRLSFKAFSNTGHDVQVSIFKHGSPFTPYGLPTTTVNLGTSYGSHSHDFMASGFAGTVNDARLRFWLAPFDASGDIYQFDDVKLELLPTPPDAENPTSQIPTEFTLAQNFPNPFNPSTTIVYTLPVDARVALDVYDVLGQRVARLVDGNIVAGYHDAVFDASALSSGLYLYRLIAVGTDGVLFTRTEKMLLTK